MDFLRGAVSTVGNTIGGAGNTIRNGLGRAGEYAADAAADAALAPLKIIENSISSVAGLGPEIVANRRNKINTLLTNIETAAKKYNDAAEAKKMRDTMAIITARVKQVRVDSTVPDEIKDKFEIILDISGETPEELLNSLANAEDDLLVHENKEFSGVRLIKRAWRVSSEYIYYILLFFCAIFGGIILSNVYINETFFPIRVYYFLYGTAFFPASLLYGIVNPPEWNATIFPWFMIAGAEPFVQRKVGGAVPTDIAQGTGRVAALRKLYEPPQVAANMKQAEATGATRVEAGQKEAAALVAKGVPAAEATNVVVSELVKGGLTPEAATQAVSAAIAPKPPTFLQRLTNIANDLFGYKPRGGSTIALRIISMVLSSTTLGWAYFKGDLSEIYGRIYQ
jgi:hypothetical protein